MSDSKYGSGAAVSDLDSTKPVVRGRPAGAAATERVASKAPPPPTQQTGFQRRGGSGGFEESQTAQGADLVPAFGQRKEQATRRFWIGTLPTCPRAVVHLAGQDFPDYCDPERQIGGGQVRRAYELGVLRDLTDAKVAAIKEAMARRFVRWTGDGRGDIYCIPTAADIEVMKAAKRPIEYPEQGDDALARHVFMVETSVRGDAYPPSAYETGVK